MKQPVTRELYAYWNELRGKRSAPDRAEIEPGALGAASSDVFMLTIAPREGYPIRIAGARLAGLMLSELKGSAFVSLFRNLDRVSIRALLASVIDDPTPVVAGISATPAGRESMALELLLLPLGVSGEPAARIFGALTPASRPRWSGLIAAGPLTLESLRILNPARAECAVQGRFDPSAWASVPMREAGTARRASFRQANLTLYNS